MSFTLFMRRIICAISSTSKYVSRSRGQLSCVRSLGIAGFLSLDVLDLLVNALTHNNADVRTAACICFRNAHVMLPLVQLLHDPSSSVQLKEKNLFQFTNRSCS
ncbi:BnaC05g10700D [Brassica napus]|uniref:BnaC05g10700D protein n=1 Tax=Brassica napus TaxID=3708 RepID=A0A078HPH6_BRANA|nr:BnaC05g10700D [Brassica napus]